MNTYTITTYTTTGQGSMYKVQAAGFTFNDEMVLFLGDDGRSVVAAFSLGLTPAITMDQTAATVTPVTG